MKTLIIIAALGMQPFQAEFLRRYVADDSPREWVAKINAANCNVCHTGASKKQRNEFGKKLDELLSKASTRADVREALKKVENLKSSDGRTYYERMAAGELPSP